MKTKTSCIQCGQPMNPVEALLGAVCGRCARENHAAVVAGKFTRPQKWMARCIGKRRARTQCIHPSPAAAQKALMRQIGDFELLPPGELTVSRPQGLICLFWDYA